jgi:CheY-like chemotaxis protein
VAADDDAQPVVLVVDDDKTFRRVLSLNLASRGAEVLQAGTEAEALAVIEARQPDLLLLDINLPDRTGWELLRELKRRDHHVRTVIASAVKVQPGRMQEWPDVQFLPKPFPMEALVRLVFGGEEQGPEGPD